MPVGGGRGGALAAWRRQPAQAAPRDKATQAAQRTWRQRVGRVGVRLKPLQQLAHAVQGQAGHHLPPHLPVRQHLAG